MELISIGMNGRGDHFGSYSDSQLRRTSSAQAVKYPQIDSSPIPHLRLDSVPSVPETSLSRLSSSPFSQPTVLTPLPLSLSPHIHQSPWPMTTVELSARASTKLTLSLVAPDSIAAHGPRLLDNPSQLAPAVH
jgi:hypothetical protein